MAKIETVTVTLNVKLPLRYYRFLEALAHLADKTVEDLLTEELYADLQSFIEGGALEGWIETIQENNKDLQKLMEQVCAE